MKKLLAIVFLFTCIAADAQYAIGGVKIPYAFKTEEGVLLLNGAGIREKYFLDLYVGALYLKNKETDARKIYEANESMSIRLHIVSGMISSSKMNAATDEGFHKSTNGNTGPLSEKIKQFKAVFEEKIKVNDIYDLVYDTNKGMLIYKNDKLMATIPGLDFKQALFGIWLCNKPADSDLKKEMLGL